MNLLDHLRTLEERLLLPSVRSDTVLLRDLLAVEFIEFGSSGRVFNRNQIISQLAREPSFPPPAISDFTLLAHTDAWALTTCRCSRPQSSGAPPLVTLRSSTWIHREDRWQMLFHQGTPVPPAIS